MTRRLTVGTLYERMKDVLELELLGPATGLDREITSPEASSPGLVLAGYINRFPYQRIQVLGETEITYLQSLDTAQRAINLPQERRTALISAAATGPVSRQAASRAAAGRRARLNRERVGMVDLR